MFRASQGVFLLSRAGEGEVSGSLSALSLAGYRPRIAHRPSGPAFDQRDEAFDHFG